MGEEILRSLTGAEVAIDFTFIAELSTFNAAFERNPSDAAVIQRALSFLEQRHREDLMAPWAERAYRVNPNHETSLFAAASCYELVGQFALAIPMWRKLAATPKSIDPLGLNLARALCCNGDLDESLAIVDAALTRLMDGEQTISRIWDQKNYMLRFLAQRAEIRLRRGNAAGFADHEAQLGFRVPSFVIPEIAYWSNEPIAGRHIIVTPVGGYGDQLLFHSLIPLLQALGARLSVAVNPDLERIFRDSLPGCTVFATRMPQTIMGPPSPEIEAFIAANKPDMQTNTFALAHMAYGLNPKGDFIFPPYLKVSSAAQAALDKDMAPLLTRAAGRKIVGITWDRAQRHFPQVVGGVEACRTARSSLPVAGLEKIVADPRIAEKVHFVALHETGAARAWPKPIPANLSTIHIEPGDFSRTAAIIKRCAAVATVDMSVANLSAMMGQRTLLMLPHEGDIRWGNAGNTSPWVRTVEVFRQPVARDWTQVCEDLTVALSALSV